MQITIAESDSSITSGNTDKDNITGLLFSGLTGLLSQLIPINKSTKIKIPMTEKFSIIPNLQLQTLKVFLKEKMIFDHFQITTPKRKRKKN